MNYMHEDYLIALHKHEWGKNEIERRKFWKIILAQEMWDNKPFKFLFHDECLTLMLKHI
jgi:hypothetical protein